MRIAVNGRFLTQPMTGVQRYAHELMQAFDSIIGRDPGLRRSLEIEVLAPPLEPRQRPTWRHLALRELGMRSGHPWEQLDLPGAVGKRLLFCPGNTAPLRVLLGRRRCVVCVHDLSFRYFPSAYSPAFRGLYHLLTPAIFARAARIITVSKTEQESLAVYYPTAQPRLRAIPNGGFGAPVLKQLGDIPAKEIGAPYILYVGALSKRKNFPGLIQAAVLLSRETNLRFVFIGGTSKALQEAEVAIPGELAGRFIFAGQLDNTAELVGWYKGAICLAFPSHYESSGLPPLEAMACGLPVVSSSIPALHERCGDAALYCEADDPANVAAAIRQVVENPNLREELRARGLARAAAYNWEHSARRHIEVFEEAIE